MLAATLWIVPLFIIYDIDIPLSCTRGYMASSVMRECVCDMLFVSTVIDTS